MITQIINSAHYEPVRYALTDLLTAHKVIMYSAPPTVQREYHGTEYVVNGRCAPNARETAPQKMLRLILNHSATI